MEFQNSSMGGVRDRVRRRPVPTGAGDGIVSVGAASSGSALPGSLPSESISTDHESEPDREDDHESISYSSGLLEIYYSYFENLIANATANQLLVAACVGLPLAVLVFGPLLFCLLAGGLGGAVMTFRALNPWRNQDLTPLPWKEDNRTAATYFNEKSIKSIMHSHYSPSQPVEAAIERGVDIIVRDYVESWYHDISPDDTTFTSSIRQTLISSAHAFAHQQSFKRPADIFLVLIFSACNTFVVFLRELRAVSSRYSNKAGRIHDYIVSYKDSALAQMVDPGIQQVKLRNAANNLIQTFLPTLDIKRSPIALLLREVVAHQVLEAAVDSLSDPDSVNSWIIYFLQREENIKELAGEMSNNTSSPAELPKTPEPSSLSRFQDNEYDAEKTPTLASTESTSLTDENSSGLASHSSSNTTSAIPTKKDDFEKRMQEVMGDGDFDRQPVSTPTTMLNRAPSAPLRSNSASHRIPRRPINSEIVDSARQSSDMSYSLDITEALESEPSRGPQSEDKSQRNPGQPVASRSGVISNARRSMPNLNDDASVDLDSTASSRPASTFDEMFQNHSLDEQSSAAVARRSHISTLEPTVTFTLYESSITVIDSSADNNQSMKVMSSRPIGFYTLVIEPASSVFAGWMAMRNISDFEKLHLVLTKLASLAGLTMFPEVFPPWMGVSRADYCQTLQSYLQLVVNTRELADCEAMKKFVDKKETTSTGEKRLLKAPFFKHTGEGMLEAISKATSATSSTKESRNAILGVLAAAKKHSSDTFGKVRDTASVASGNGSQGSGNSTKSRQSFLPSGPDFSGIAASMRNFANGGGPTLPSLPFMSHTDGGAVLPGYQVDMNESTNSLASTIDSTTQRISTEGGSDSYIPEVRVNNKSIGNNALASSSTPVLISGGSALRSVDSRTSSEADLSSEIGSPRHSMMFEHDMDRTLPRSGMEVHSLEQRQSLNITAHTELTQGETNSIIDTMFLAISELYLLSNAWNVRRSLLTMLRGLLLRNGSSSVEGIRLALQKDVIDKYSSDAEIARKLNDLINSIWPSSEQVKPKLSESESTALREKARQMFVSRTIPDAIKSVMGAAASTQALEFVFDVLQDRNIARGMVLDLVMDCITALLM
ncbi:PXA domain-containing protein [Lipomyces oligophaga]|uniref:PXA domain-containing protein n=1 Tax=Lipomyces oligophaga TaxID=45792 RepID=UPI0034CDCAE4